MSWEACNSAGPYRGRMRGLMTDFLQVTTCKCQYDHADVNEGHEVPYSFCTPPRWHPGNFMV